MYIYVCMHIYIYVCVLRNKCENRVLEYNNKQSKSSRDTISYDLELMKNKTALSE